jgi:hypothetical protein
MHSRQNTTGKEEETVMQMRKQWRKRNRDEYPCRWCGKDHETKECPKVSMKGRPRPGQKEFWE